MIQNASTTQGALRPRSMWCLSCVAESGPGPGAPGRTAWRRTRPGPPTVSSTRTGIASRSYQVRLMAQTTTPRAHSGTSTTTAWTTRTWTGRPKIVSNTRPPCPFGVPETTTSAPQHVRRVASVHTSAHTSPDATDTPSAPLASCRDSGHGVRGRSRLRRASSPTWRTHSRSPVPGARPRRRDQAGPDAGERRGHRDRAAAARTAGAGPTRRRRPRRGVRRLRRPHGTHVGARPDRRHQELRPRRARLGHAHRAARRRARRSSASCRPRPWGDAGGPRRGAGAWGSVVGQAARRLQRVGGRPARGRLGLVQQPRRVGSPATGLRGAARARLAELGPTATSGATCSSPRARSTSRPSRSWPSGTSPR